MANEAIQLGTGAQSPGTQQPGTGTQLPGTAPATPDVEPITPVTPAESAAPQYTEVEKLAMQMGWNPEHDGAGNRPFQTADQYILRTQEIQKTMGIQINALKDQTEEFKQGMQNLVQHYQGMTKIEASKIDGEITVLNSQKEKAIEDANIALVKELDGKIDNLKTQKVMATKAAETPDQPGAQPGVQPGVQPTTSKLTAAAQTWVTENPWYGTNKEMTSFADAQSDRFRGLPEDKYFTELTKAVKTMYPQSFPAARQTAPVLPPGGRPPGGGDPKKFTINDLSEDQRKWATFYEKQGVMKTEAYIQELVDRGVLTKGE